MFGSIFSELKDIEFESADGHAVKILGRFERLGLKIIGIPHLGLRLRARRISKYLKPKKEDSVLDAGTGSGVYALTLASKGYSIAGIDIDKRKLAMAQRLSDELKLSAKFTYGDLTKLALGKKFDWILCSDVLEHIDKDTEAIKSLARVCKKKGTLIITTASDIGYNQIHYKEYGHARPGYNEFKLRSMLEEAGLSVQKIIWYEGPFSRLAWRVNRFSFRNKILAALLFFPLYAFSFLDYLIPEKFKKQTFDGLLVIATK